MLRIQLLLCSVIICTVLQGCIFSPHKGDTKVDPPPTYVKPLNPEAVLYNLALAYTHRDSLEYKSLYHEQYQGSFIDQRDPFPVLATYFKSDEAQHIAFVAQNTASVDLEISTSLVRIVDLGDPAGWITIQNPFSKLEIDGIKGHLNIVPGTAEDTIDMKFIPIPPSTTGADTTWQIIRVIEARR